jgi:hypothetical protein
MTCDMTYRQDPAGGVKHLVRRRLVRPGGLSEPADTVRAWL